MMNVINFFLQIDISGYYIDSKQKDILVKKHSFTMCNAIKKKINSRLIMVLLQNFFKSLSNSLTCPVRPGKYVMNKFALGEVPLTPRGIFLPDLKIKVNVFIYLKEKANDIFVANITMLAVFTTNKKKNFKG